MPHKIEDDARAVLLPAFADTTLSDPVCRFLESGGVSILLGESRAEYVARAMSPERRARETAETFRTVTQAARARSGSLLAFVDVEMGGINRLHDLVPGFPPADSLADTPPAEIEAIACAVASRARDMGVNAFLAPIVDVLTGPNPWLAERIWSADPARVGDLSAAYVRGVQKAGVAATIKHFPGFGHMTGDPAIEASATNVMSRADLERSWTSFSAPIAADAAMVMVGPAVVAALDPERAALRSAQVVGLLRNAFGFAGLVMADDLDAAATLRGDSVAQAAIEALLAGCDLLMLADIDNQVEEVAQAIIAAVQSGQIAATALEASANRVRTVARRYEV